MKILVPTDFSKNAQKAVEFASKMVQAAGSEIILLHAHQIIDTESPTRKLLFQEYNLSIARRLHDELEAQKRKIKTSNSDIKVSAQFCDDEVEKSIVDASENLGIDLIIMGTQGASSLKNFFMGSVTARVIGKAAVPILAVPRLYKWKEPKKILLTTSNFERETKVLNTIFGLVDLFKAHLHVIVFTDSTTADTEDYNIQKNSLDNYHQLLEKINKETLITSAHLRGTEFEDTVQQYIDKHSIDMLAMITYKRNFLENIFHRCATKRMAYRARVPLLAIPA